MIRFKSNAWQYEYELRLLSKKSWGFVNIPSNWLKSIITGLSICKKLRNKLENIGKELGIPIFLSTMNKNEYKIDIPGLKIDGEIGKSHYNKIIDSKIFEIE